MRPAWSVIIFTVLSGMGFGMSAALPFVSPLLPGGLLVAAGGAGGLLVAAGLGASTAHLANPKNAWRSLFRLRTSWLSREAALALLFFPLLAAWLCAAFFRSAAELPLAMALVVVSAATVFCTAMIYGALKPVRLWRHPLTPINYLLLAAFSGALPVAAVCAAHWGEAPPLMAAVLVALNLAAAAGKWLHFRRAAPVAADVGAAVGLRAANVRLLESGHTAPNFITREFVYHAAAAHLRWARWLTAVGVFALPLAACVLAPVAGAVVLWAALPFLLSGLLAERWLFFAEARHAVRQYHGENES